MYNTLCVLSESSPNTVNTLHFSEDVFPSLLCEDIYLTVFIFSPLWITNILLGRSVKIGLPFLFLLSTVWIFLEMNHLDTTQTNSQQLFFFSFPYNMYFVYMEIRIGAVKSVRILSWNPELGSCSDIVFLTVNQYVFCSLSNFPGPTS